MFRILLPAVTLLLLSSSALADVPPDTPKEDKSGCMVGSTTAAAPLAFGLIALVSLRRR